MSGNRKREEGGETGPHHLERTRVSLCLGVKDAWDPPRKQARVHRPWRWQSGPPTGSGRTWDLDTFGQFLWLFRPRNINAVFSLCFLIVTWDLSQVHCGTMELPGRGARELPRISARLMPGFGVLT